MLNENTGTSNTALRNLTISLAKHAIFGREELAQCSLSGRKNTATLNECKVNHIKALIRGRVLSSSAVEFEYLWDQCRASLSKCCQSLRRRGGTCRFHSHHQGHEHGRRGVWVSSTRAELVKWRASRTLCVGLYILSSASFVSGSIHTPQSKHR